MIMRDLPELLKQPNIMLKFQSITDLTSMEVTVKDKTRYVLIEPVMISDIGGDWETTGIFNILKDSFFDNSALAFASLDLQDEYAEIPNDCGPDYLGRILFDDNDNWIYDGDTLSIDEQELIGEFIQNYNASDVIY